MGTELDLEQGREKDQDGAVMNETPLEKFSQQAIRMTAMRLSEFLDAEKTEEAWFLSLFVTFVQDPDAARVEIDAEMKRRARDGNLKAMRLRRYAEMTKTSVLWPKWDAKDGSLRLETYAEGAIRHLMILLGRNTGHEMRNYRAIMHTMVAEGFFTLEVGEKYVALALAQRDAKK